MRHLLLTIITLFVAGTAMADSYMYIEDFEVPSGEHQITVPVRAHFNAFVSAFQLDITYPDGLVPVETTVGADMAIGYYDNNGRSQTVQLSLFSNELKNRFIAAIMTDGYYDTDGSGNYESYGVVKWEAGYYDEMFLLTMDVMEGFQGGEIILESNLSSGRDTRGETVSTLGETYSTSVCNVTTGPAPLLTLTGDIIIGENVDLMVPVLYTGEEEVTMTISVNGDEVISGNAHQYDLNLPGYGEWTIHVKVEAPGYENLETTYMIVVSEPEPEEDYTLTIADAEVLCGNTVVIPVSMTNASAVTAFQTDLYLPDGFELLDVVLSNRKSDHGLMTNVMANGGLRILCYSPSLARFAGDEGELFYITVQVPETAAGDYTLMLKNSLLSTVAYQEEHCEDDECNLHVKTFTPGDVNNDGQITVTDVVLIAQYILGQSPDPFIFEAADMTGDGEITVTDLVLVVRLILDPNYVELLPGGTVLRGINNDAMSAEGISLSPGETRTITIAMDNDIAYTAFQLDLQLPDGLTASNFRLTDRAGSHLLSESTLDDGKQRVMCYSPALALIDGHEGALLTFEVTASSYVGGDINVDGIEMVSGSCQTLYFDSFAIGVNRDATAVKELNTELRIYSDGHDIIVESPASQQVVICDMAGHAYSVNVTEGRNVIPCRFSGVVVVSAGNKSAKLMVE